MSITKYLAASYWAESHFKTHYPDTAPTLNIWFTIWKPLTVSCYQNASPLSAISKTLLIKAASLRRESHQQSMHSGIMVLQKLGLNLFYASNYTPCINFQKTSFDLETFLRSLII